MELLSYLWRQSIMSLEGWSTNPDLGKVPCITKRESWQCPNMKYRSNDTDMSGETYECKVCGKREYIDYDDIR